MLLADGPLGSVLRFAHAISILPTPEQLRARLLAAAEAGDVEAAWFILTFVPWAAWVTKS